jgi:hypothetical protein
MSNECDVFRRQIPQALLGDLTEPERQELDRHLSECLACRLEREQFTRTLDTLRSVADVPVPRHFFVYPEEARTNPWQLFRRMSFGWQATLATAAALLAVFFLAAASRLQLRVSDGVLYASLGKLPPGDQAPAPDLSPDFGALEARILQAVEQKARTDDREWVRILRAEISRSLGALSAEQRALLDTALNNLENRMSTSITLAAQSLRDEAAASRQQLYQVVTLERQHDLTLFNDRLSQLAISGEIKTNQTDAILETLLQVADLRLGNNPGGQR